MTKPKRFIVVSDIHGDQQDYTATKAALAFTADFKPEIRVIAGDLWDFGAIRKGASQDEQSVSMASDYEAGRLFANEFFKGGTEKHLLLGNHDIRVWDLAHSTDAVRADLGKRMANDITSMAARWKARILPYDSRHGVLELGFLKVVHGYHTGASACASHSRIYGNVIFGHVHSIESFQTPGLKQQEARAIGCLCKLDQDYADRKTGKLRWAHGFAYGWLFPDGTYQLNQARSVNGKFYASHEIRPY
jgi:predicted phosphodiesterase